MWTPLARKMVFFFLFFMMITDLFTVLLSFSDFSIIHQNR